jgi:hypothetical protein
MSDLPGKPFPVILERIGWASRAQWWSYVTTDPKSSFKEIKFRYLAKLGFKEEAAGKVRVFAMVDAWTQWVMRPIHDMIFGILRFIPMDGTFDQTSPVDRLRHLSVKDRWFYSIDLSAATDRLPILLQVPLMKYLFKECGMSEPALMARDWADLLVGREYQVKVPDASRGFDIPKDIPKSVTYSVGQPMGALSSWAMLAMTHHAIVQWAAHRARGHGRPVPILFREYAILGDDLVIANRDVALEYLLILQRIGVKAGLAKSIVSKGKFYAEFAKKFFVPSGRADMLPFKEVISVYSSTLLTCEFVKIHKLSLNAILAFLGFGYKARSQAKDGLYHKLSKRLRTLLVWFRSPVGCFPLSIEDWVKSSGFNSSWDVPDDWENWWYVRSYVDGIAWGLLRRYIEAYKRYIESIEVTGTIYSMEKYLSSRMIKESTPELRKVRIPLAKTGKLVRPISQHPPFLTEVLVRDDSINQFVTEPVPFSVLVAPIDYDLYESTGIADATEFNRKYGVVDYVHTPVVKLPKAVRDHDLIQSLSDIRTTQMSEKDKTLKLLEWIFNFDNVASLIPSSYW